MPATADGMVTVMLETVTREVFPEHEFRRFEDTGIRVITIRGPKEKLNPAFVAISDLMRRLDGEG